MFAYPQTTRPLKTKGELQANDFAEVQGLTLSLRAFVNSISPEIHFVPEPNGLAGVASGVALLMLFAHTRKRGQRLGRIGR